MQEEIANDDIARQSTPPEYDTARHSLTIPQTVELFAELGVPRSKRSVQRFCEQGHLDSVRIKGPRGDQFFINRESVVRYAEELRSIEAVASIAGEPRHDAPQHATARYSAPERATTREPVAVVSAPPPERGESEVVIEQLRKENAKLQDENLNLRIDNRGKEQAINFIAAQAREKDQQLHEISYRLGAAETRVAQLEAPKVHDDGARQSATETAPAPIDAIVIPERPTAEAAPEPEPQPKAAEPRRSMFGGIFGRGRG